MVLRSELKLQQDQFLDLLGNALRMGKDSRNFFSSSKFVHRSNISVFSLKWYSVKWFGAPCLQISCCISARSINSLLWTPLRIQSEFRWEGTSRYCDHSSYKATFAQIYFGFRTGRCSETCKAAESQVIFSTEIYQTVFFLLHISRLKIFIQEIITICSIVNLITRTTVSLCAIKQKLWNENIWMNIIFESVGIGSYIWI